MEINKSSVDGRPDTPIGWRQRGRIENKTHKKIIISAPHVPKNIMYTTHCEL